MNTQQRRELRKFENHFTGIFRMPVFVENAETIEHFSKSGQGYLTSQIEAINLLIDSYNNLLKSLDVVFENEARLMILKSVEEIDERIELLLDVLNKDLDELTAILNLVA